MKCMKSAVSLGVWVLCLSLGLNAGQAAAQPLRPAQPAPLDQAEAMASSKLYLRAGTFDASAAPMMDVRAAGPAAFEAGRPYVVQLKRPITAEVRDKLTQAGVELGGYLPDNAYIARLGRVRPEQLAALEEVGWVGAYQDAWKIDPEIGLRHVPFQTAERMGLEAFGEVQLIVALFPGEDVDEALEQISATGAQLLGATDAGEQSYVDVTIAADEVDRLAAIGAVQFIEEAPEVVMRNDTTTWIIQSNVSGQTPVWANGIIGQGQIGGLIDGPARESHCSFDDSVSPGPSHRKITLYQGTIGSDSHGTHTAGTFVGDAPPYYNQDPVGQPSFRDGMAFAAKMTMIPVNPIYSNPSSFELRLQDAHNAGARVHSNSWGDDGTTSYTTWCRQIDKFSRDFEESMVAFAVTNTSTLKTPENAKNVLAVGASQDSPNQNNHCSGGQGPTSDGRRKPEVYAPGCSTQSSSSSTSCGWAPLTGTSMACPAVSGMGLLVRQYFTDGFYPSGSANAGDAFVPSGALLRAVLINSSVNMTGVAGYPSNREGWGRLLLDNGLYFPGDARQLMVDDVRNANGFTGSGQSQQYQINVTSSAEPLRVTLVWTDVPATIGSSNPAINNLDLVVTAPGGATYFGNVFDTTAGQSQAGGARDLKNNIEQVHLLTPAPGIYSVNVEAIGINQLTQGYALVVTGALLITPPDCNGNEIPDDEDIANGTSADCNASGIPDECENLDDCNMNGQPDTCEHLDDCNNNGVPDVCDVADGTSPDCDGNLVPDECDEDCNDSGLPDACDVINGTSPDCNGNLVPDECDVRPNAPPLVFEVPVDPPLEISNWSEWSSSRFVVAETGKLADVNVWLEISHSWNGDLLVQLTHGAITSTLINRPGQRGGVGDGHADDGFAVLIDDQAETTIHEATADGGAVTGTFSPARYRGGTFGSAPLGIFNDREMSGEWTLWVTDLYPTADVGTLDGWALHLTPRGGGTSTDCNNNGIPDECEADCNSNEKADECDIATGYSQDANGNGIPDECEPGGVVGDCDGDGEVTLLDFNTFAECFTGPGVVLLEGCECADLSGDGDVDLEDFSTFSLLMVP